MEVINQIKIMTESELKSRLQKKYDHSTWKNLLSSIFPKVEYLLHPSILAEKTDTAKSVRQIGNLTIADGNIGIFEVEVSSRKNITRNRVELRKIAAAYIDQDIINGAFVFYYASNQNDYRFTFIAKKSNLTEEGELVKYQTPPKRYTYVLGPNESCTTAAKRLLELEHSENISLDNVIQAFSLEKLNKEFFKKYKEHYQKLCDELAHSNFRKSVFNLQNFKDKKENDKAEKPIRDFVKLLLGRIVFLHFLQKKSWLGCPANSEMWKEGDFQFLYNLYTNYKDKNHFLSKCLNRLFFDTLNTKRDGDIFEFTKTRVPYLNGGLFDNVHPEYEQIDFPAIRFEELFDFFSQYNFTIDESSPDEHEVGIDPEMLSHIFENLLEDNKDKGAFYTPKEIVHYMCHESLIQYLKTNLIDGHPERSEGSQGIENFIHNQEVSQFIRDNAKEIDSLLDKVKICDLAIGSGAFPMGMLKEIFQAKLLLYPYLKTNKRFDPAVVKRNIIQNSIYGVDIDSGAVDIARLRFWLALIVDEEEPTPLLNLDYKIMQGNSLLESFEGIDLSTVTKPESFQIKVHNPQLRLDGSFEDGQTQIIFTDNEKNNLSELMKHYYSVSERKEKEKLHKQIDKIVLNSIHRILDKHRLNLESALLEYKEKTKTFEKYGGKSGGQQLKKLRAKDYESIERLELQIKEVDNKFEKLSELYSKSERPFFLWHLYFQDVFDNGGFDIVIGNPPYINVENLEESLKNYLFDHYTSCFGRTDIYIAFIEKSLELIVKNGCLTFIVPYAFTNQKYGSKLRKKLIDNYTISEILDTSDFLVFDSANVKNIIIRVTNGPITKSTIIKNVKNILEFQHGILDIRLIDQNAFLQLKDYRLETKPVIDTLQLRDKVLHDSIPFSDICFVAYGARLNHKTKKISKDNYVKNIFAQGLKPFLEGKNIDRFIHSQSGWLDYRPKEHYNPMFEQLFENDKLMFINVVKDKLRFTIDTNHLWNSHTVINCVKWNLLEGVEHVSIKRNFTEKRKELSSRFNYKYLLAILNSNLIN